MNRREMLKNADQKNVHVFRRTKTHSWKYPYQCEWEPICPLGSVNTYSYAYDRSVCNAHASFSCRMTGQSKARWYNNTDCSSWCNHLAPNEPGSCCATSAKVAYVKLAHIAIYSSSGNLFEHYQNRCRPYDFQWSLITTAKNWIEILCMVIYV